MPNATAIDRSIAHEHDIECMLFIHASLDCFDLQALSVFDMLDCSRDKRHSCHPWSRPRDKSEPTPALGTGPMQCIEPW